MPLRHALLLLPLLLALGCQPSETATDESAATDAAATPARTVAAPPFDPSADPNADLQAALDRARREGKRVILDVGGEWCIWCHRMDDFIGSHPDLGALRDQYFVWQKVNFSDENENEAFLAHYPEVAGYPHLFVLDADGTLLQSQDTSELESGDSYDAGRFRAFFERWAPAGAAG